MSIVGRLIKYRRTPFLGKAVQQVLHLYGVDIPSSVQIGRNSTFHHRAHGVVLHSQSVLGNNVHIYHGVTIGKSRLDQPIVGRIYIEDGVVIGANAVILVGGVDRTIGAGAMIGANSVVVSDVPPGETWAGNPAQSVAREPRGTARG